MKAIASITILATFIAIVGAQSRHHSSTTEQALDRTTTTGTATDADASLSMTDTALSMATDSPSAKSRTVSGSRTKSDALETSTDSASDADATSTWDDENIDTWTDTDFTPAPSMIASQPLSIPPKLTPITGPATAYASSSMLPAATRAANPSLLSNAGSRVGIPSCEWLALGLIAAVAAILL